MEFHAKAVNHPPRGGVFAATQIFAPIMMLFCDNRSPEPGSQPYMCAPRYVTQLAADDGIEGPLRMLTLMVLPAVCAAIACLLLAAPVAWSFAACTKALARARRRRRSQLGVPPGIQLQAVLALQQLPATPLAKDAWLPPRARKADSVLRAAAALLPLVASILPWAMFLGWQRHHLALKTLMDSNIWLYEQEVWWLRWREGFIMAVAASGFLFAAVVCQGIAKAAVRYPLPTRWWCCGRRPAADGWDLLGVTVGSGYYAEMPAGGGGGGGRHWWNRLWHRDVNSHGDRPAVASAVAALDTPGSASATHMLLARQSIDSDFTELV